MNDNIILAHPPLHDELRYISLWPSYQMFEDRLDDNGGIFRCPLATVVPINVGDAKSRGVTHAPFQVTASKGKG